MRSFPAAVSVALVLATACHAARSAPKLEMAPELSGGLAWLNTEKPIRMADLRGQIVVLEFWTYG